MKKLTFADLTPEFLIELKAFKTAEEIVGACAKKGREISLAAAAKLLDQFRKAEQLSREKLTEVAGGGKGYSGTRSLFGFIKKHAAACEEDEYDEDEEDPVVRISDREYQVLGSMNLEDLCDIIPLGFSSEDYDTIGGYIVGAFDHFPTVGETYVSENGIIVRVLAVEKKRITKLRIKLPVQADESQTK